MTNHKPKEVTKDVIETLTPIVETVKYREGMMGDAEWGHAEAYTPEALKLMDFYNSLCDGKIRCFVFGDDDV